MTTLSLVIPAYNEEGYIESTLKSVKAQSIPSEIIVVANGCSDNTATIAKKYANVIELGKAGTAKSRNVGAKAAQGEILIFLDADTKLVGRDCLKSIVENFKRRHSSGTCKLKTHEKTSFFKFIVRSKNLLAFFGNSNGIIVTRREVFRKVGGFKEELKYGEDGHFIRKCSRHGFFKVFPAYVDTSMRRYKKWRTIKAIMFCLDHYILRRNREYEAIR